jgi:hypothetical protein
VYNLLQNLQVSAKVKHYLRCCFARKSLEVLIPYRYALSLRLVPRKDSTSCNVALRCSGRRGRCNSSEAGGRGRAGVGTGWSRGALGSIWEVGQGGDGAGGGVRRCQASAGTRAPASASSRSWQENGRRAQLYGILGEAPGASAGSEGEWSDGSSAAALISRWRALWRVAMALAFYRWSSPPWSQEGHRGRQPRAAARMAVG